MPSQAINFYIYVPVFINQSFPPENTISKLSGKTTGRISIKIETEYILEEVTVKGGVDY